MNPKIFPLLLSLAGLPLMASAQNAFFFPGQPQQTAPGREASAASQNALNRAAQTSPLAIKLENLPVGFARLHFYYTRPDGETLYAVTQPQTFPVTVTHRDYLNSPQGRQIVQAEIQRAGGALIAIPASWLALPQEMQADAKKQMPNLLHHVTPEQAAAKLDQMTYSTENAKPIMIHRSQVPTDRNEYRKMAPLKEIYGVQQPIIDRAVQQQQQYRQYQQQ